MAKKAEEGVLNDAQLSFCEYYAISHNGAEAARKAGYSAKTAASQAHRLLMNAEIKRYISILEDEAGRSLAITKENILRHMADVAFTSGKGMTKIMALKYLGDSFGTFEKQDAPSEDTGADPAIDEERVSGAVERVEKT